MFNPTLSAKAQTCVRIAGRGLCLIFSALALQALVPAPQAVAQSKVPTAEDLSRLPAMTSFTISPDGSHFAAITSVDGKTAQVSVWETNNLAKPPSVLGSAANVRFMSVSFVKNERLAVQARQLATYDTYRGHVFNTIFTDLTGSKWFTGVPDQNQNCVGICSNDVEIEQNLFKGQVLSSLPKDPQNVIVQAPNGTVYKSNLYTGKYEFVANFNDKESDPFFDNEGVLRSKIKMDYSSGSESVVQLILNPETKQFEEHFRSLLRDREIPSVIALTPDPNIVLIRARRGKDHTAIYNYDVKARKFLDVAFEHPTFDVGGVSVNPNNNEVRYFTYLGERVTRYYVDDKLDALNQSIEKALGLKTTVIDWKDLATLQTAKLRIPDGASVYLVDKSDDDKVIIFAKEGAATPSDYFIYREGQPIVELGRERPWLDTSLLSDGKLEQFTARDGRPIPAYVYLPNVGTYGKGPYPTIILPHGGPWSRDYNDSVDPWVQYFVARGFAVAKPQFRGSEEWGLAQWSAGDSKWGEEMSDDMDDVGLGLIKQGLADANRMVMHGYSFGGYSAMAAIVRPKPIYVCAISGAGPPSPTFMRERNDESKFQTFFQKPFVGGLDALAHAKDASIPILMYHGDRDTNVIPIQSKMFYDALKGNGKKAERIIYKDMGHPWVTWTPDHMSGVLTMIDNYLKTDCKPGGL